MRQIHDVENTKRPNTAIWASPLAWQAFARLTGLSRTGPPEGRASDPQAALPPLTQTLTAARCSEPRTV